MEGTEKKQSFEQLAEKRRLAMLLIEAVNKIEECVDRLRQGFINDSDRVETQKKVKQIHSAIMKIDEETIEKLNHSSAVEPPGEQSAEDNNQ